MHHARKQAGFTLLELMVTITVLVVLVSVAVPSFNTTLRNNCATSSANALLSLLTLAKNESQRRGRSVTVCPSNAASTGCASTASSWETGVLAYVDTDKDHTVDADEEVIRAIVPLSTCAVVTPSNTFTNYIAFDSLSAPNANGNFAVVPRNQTAIERRLKVSRPSKLIICNVQTDTNCTSTP